MKQIEALIRSELTIQSSKEKLIKFSGPGLLIGTIGSKTMTYIDEQETEKSYRLATAKVLIDGLGEKNLLLQVHDSNFRLALGLDASVDLTDDQRDDACETFESGELYLCTVCPIAKSDNSGHVLSGNISNLLYNDFNKFQGVYRFTDYYDDYQKYFLIILRSAKALLLYEKRKDRIHLNSILDLYEESYDSYEELAINFQTRKNESTLNLFSVKSVEGNFIELESNYNQMLSSSTFQCLKIKANFHKAQNPSGMDKLILDQYTSQKESIQSKKTIDLKTVSEAWYSKFT
ncbi:hypothetical protein SAMN05192588_2498 [Nonlabens sp. Hel1_33_55]|uniref:hypothetical protein n=1 Tax=Nonlabens sp. Hel1_33_55 TaxID=1336802 RepID=UPI000875DE19|nr:hypothetical protein [Nonlabens sp. Hel1_33_55]SCY36441.1 hypothetical protein SAMN05192588_2498 [Nonlabens sp. Hel1_33_55]